MQKIEIEETLTYFWNVVEWCFRLNAVEIVLKNSTKFSATSCKWENTKFESCKFILPEHFVFPAMLRLVVLHRPNWLARWIVRAAVVSTKLIVIFSRCPVFYSLTNLLLELESHSHVLLSFRHFWKFRPGHRSDGFWIIAAFLVFMANEKRTTHIYLRIHLKS